MLTLYAIFCGHRLKVLGIKMPEIWLYQDGATALTSNVSSAVVREIVPQHFISRFGYLLWPARSPDLSVCDVFFWGHVKCKVYSHKPRLINDLEVETIVNKLLHSEK